MGSPLSSLGRQPQPVSAEELVAPERRLPAEVRRFGEEVGGGAVAPQPDDPGAGLGQHLDDDPAVGDAQCRARREAPCAG